MFDYIRKTILSFTTALSSVFLSSICVSLVNIFPVHFSEIFTLLVRNFLIGCIFFSILLGNKNLYTNFTLLWYQLLGRVVVLALVNSSLFSFIGYLNIFGNSNVFLYYLQWILCSSLIFLLLHFFLYTSLPILQDLLWGISVGLLFIVISIFYKILFQIKIFEIVDYCIFYIILAGAIYFRNILSLQNWIMFLNGTLAGKKFSLDREVTTIGSHSNNNICLKNYLNVNYNHLKVVRYGTQLTVLDNDPYMKTWVNFRSAREYILKNGDLIKIGCAEFQYVCK